MQPIVFNVKRENVKHHRTSDCWARSIKRRVYFRKWPPNWRPCWQPRAQPSLRQCLVVTCNSRRNVKLTSKTSARILSRTYFSLCILAKWRLLWPNPYPKNCMWLQLKYAVIDLNEDCIIKFLQLSINADNVFLILIWAHNYQVNKIKEKWITFAVEKGLNFSCTILLAGKNWGIAAWSFANCW